MHVPNWVKVYGSQYMSIQAYSSYKSYKQKITISKSHLKSLDQPSERCTEDTKGPNVSACIAKFIEGQLGCSAKIQGSGSTQKITCNNVTQLKTLSDKFKDADANLLAATCKHAEALLARTGIASDCLIVNQGADRNLTASKASADPVGDGSADQAGSIGTCWM